MNQNQGRPHWVVLWLIFNTQYLRVKFNSPNTWIKHQLWTKSLFEKPTVHESKAMSAYIIKDDGRWVRNRLRVISKLTQLAIFDAITRWFKAFFQIVVWKHLNNEQESCKRQFFSSIEQHFLRSTSNGKRLPSQQTWKESRNKKRIIRNSC